MCCTSPTRAAAVPPCPCGGRAGQGWRRAANIAAVVERMLLIRRGRALLACWLQRADNHKLSTMLLVYGGNVRRSRALRRWSAAASTSALSKARCERALEVCTRRMRRARLASALISWLAMLWRVRVGAGSCSYRRPHMVQRRSRVRSAMAFTYRRSRPHRRGPCAPRNHQRSARSTRTRASCRTSRRHHTHA